jgi:methyl-accepting chemotaxis protein
MKVTLKRKNYFINKEFQGRYIFNAFLLLTFGSVLFVLIFSFFSSSTLSIVYENYHLRLGTTPGILLNKILSTQWLFIVFGGIVITLITLFLTHRVAGPFFRFEKTFDRMIEKDISVRIALRPKDEGKVLANKINDFNVMMSFNLYCIRNNAERASLCCQKVLMEGTSGDVRAVAVSDLEKIRQYAQDTVSILNAFKIIKD